MRKNMRLRVLYCDDQPEFLEEFRTRHGEEFDIETLDDVCDLYRLLAERAEKDLPDVVLLDLYHPSPSRRDDPASRAAQTQAKKKLQELTEKIYEVRESVNRAWSPLAIDVLEELHERFGHKLPVMIYTQRGLLLLKDEEIRRIEDAGSEWLFKDTDRIEPTTEARRIRRFVDRTRAADHLPRDVKLTIVSVAASLGGAVVGAVLTLLVS